MKNLFKSVLGVFLALLFVSSPAFATVTTFQDGTQKGEAIQLNFTNGPTVTYSSGLSAVDFSTVSDSRSRYAADSASNDTYVVAPTPAWTAYAAGQTITFLATTANTGAATVNVSGLGAKALKRGVSTDPGDNFIKAGSIVVAVYDGTNFQMIQPAAQ